MKSEEVRIALMRGNEIECTSEEFYNDVLPEMKKYIKEQVNQDCFLIAYDAMQVYMRMIEKFGFEKLEGGSQ